MTTNQPTNSIRLLLATVVALAGGIGLAAGIGVSAVVAHKTQSVVTQVVTPFITECNGVPVVQNDKIGSKNQCVSRIQGILEGQRLAAEMALDYSKNVSMFCAPASATGSASFDPLVKWYNDNPQLVDSIHQQYDSGDAHAAVVIAALNAVYPCN